MDTQTSQHSADTGVEPIELELLAPVQGGQTLARLSGQVVFIHGGIAGEIVRVEAPVRKRGYLEADALEVLRSAPVRVTPPCPYFGESGRRRGAIDSPVQAPGPVCGGCQYQHVDYPAQLTLKRDIVRDVLRRVGKIIDPPVGDTIASPSPYAYRNKATWLITEDGEPAYREARSHTAVPIASCHLLTPTVHTILEVIHAASADIGLAGLVQGIEARALPNGMGAEEGTLVLDLSPTTTPDEATVLADALIEILPVLKSVVAGSRSRSGPSREGEPQLLAGVARTEVAFLDEQLSLSPATFFQVNLAVAETMARYVLDECGTVAGRQVLDVYSGAGTFTLPLARQADSVIALEIDAGAVADARESIARASLDNVTLLHGDAAANLRAVLPGSVDCAVIDPPRSGCTPDSLRQLTRIKAPRLIYISCDAATLARDLRGLLDTGYELDSVRPFDLFPQTAHIESVATLRLPRKFRARK